MTALQTLRALRCATAADVAEQSGIAIEYVYLDLVAAQSEGLSTLRRVERTGKRALWQWVAL